MAITFLSGDKKNSLDQQRNSITQAFKSSSFYDPMQTGAQVLTTVKFNGEDYIFGNSATAGQFREYINSLGLRTNFLSSPTSDVNQRVQIREQLPSDSKAQLKALVPFLFAGLALVFIFR